MNWNELTKTVTIEVVTLSNCGVEHNFRVDKMTTVMPGVEAIDMTNHLYGEKKVSFTEK